jgi:probable addiction module antidote protein
MATRPYSDTLNEALRDPRDAAAYLEAALQEEDEEGFLLALRTVAEVHGIAEVARKAGVGRESLYKTLREDGNPKLHTLTALLHSLGLRLSVIPENNQQSAAY